MYKDYDIAVSDRQGGEVTEGDFVDSFCRELRINE